MLADLVKSIEAHIAAVEAHLQVDWVAWLKLFHDVSADMPKFVAAATLIKAVAGELGQGQMPTPEQVAQFASDATLLTQLISDLQAVV